MEFLKNIDMALLMPILVVAILIIAAMFVLFKFILGRFFTKKEVIEFVFDAILWAEDNIIGTEAGKEKLAYVCGKLNKYLPKWLQPVITVKVLEDFVNGVFEIMKEELEEFKEKIE